MELIALIGLLLLAVILIVVEIIFIPGTTFVGILGFICLVSGIFTAFNQFGEKTGNIVLLSSGVFLIITTIYIFKAKTWEKIALNDSVSSKVNVLDSDTIQVDCIAMAVSDLKPMGTIEFENQQFEAESQGEFIGAKSSVRVISINNNQIIVEKLSKV